MNSYVTVTNFSSFSAKKKNNLSTTMFTILLLAQFDEFGTSKHLFFLG
jgi:hypothetical protein